MDKYIKADDLIDRIYPVDPGNDGSDGCTIVMQTLKLSSQEIEAIVDEIPAADVAPVVHGRWIVSRETGDTYYHMNCSICGQFWRETHQKNILRFCPNCGAKMGGDVND